LTLIVGVLGRALEAERLAERVEAELEETKTLTSNPNT